MTASAIGSANGAVMKIQGLGSGLKTEEIVSELMSIERRPLTHLEQEQTINQAQHTALQGLQTDLLSLSLSAGELKSPALFTQSQAVSSSEPLRVSATNSGSGSAIGGYEVEVTQLASAAQRTFTFKSPTAAESLSIDGHEVKLTAGESISEFADSINSNSESSVYAAAVNGETVVLSGRATGNTGSSFIEVSDPGGTLTEKAGQAKEGRNAEYSINGVSGSSASNTLTEAIPGVTLTLNALTPAGPVTINVAPPAAEVSKITEQVKAFVTQYNTTLEAIEKEENTKPAIGLQAEAENTAGRLFGDSELSGLLATMREAIYTPVSGLPAQMSSLADIGVNTGAASGASPYSQASVEGKLVIDEATLEEAIKTNPEGVEKMLKQWGGSFESTINTFAEPGVGTLASRIGGDESESTYITQQITTLTESLAVRQQALEARYVALETAMSKISSQGSWLSSQLASLPGFSSGSSSSSSI
ncbi:MAG: flagellar filament capping protein FliD [Solirubrobacteraceae bacterium]